MHFSRIFVGVLLLLPIIILPSFTYASNDKTSSPLMQLNNGTSTQNIDCPNNLKLIYKSTNDYPSCVKPQTSANLIKRGWGILQPANYLIKVSGVLVPYNITEGKIHDAKLYKPSESVFFSFNMTSNGVLNVTLPRTLIKGTCNERCVPTLVGKDVPFMILNQNGQEVYSMEIGTTPINRTLSIHIPSSTKQIEIFIPQPI